MTNDTIFTEHRAWLLTFYAGRWATSLCEGTITRDEYVSTLVNLHSYVRDTTRLLGLAIQCAEGREFAGLRKHFASHLSGEVNHELLLERDLEALGAGGAWCREPNYGARSFGCLQRSLLAWDRDPIAFLACPMTAEGVSACMGPAHLEGLSRAVESWGVDAKKATSFLSSHMHTDGDDGGGHNKAVVRQVQKHVRTDGDVRRFLSVQREAQRSFLSAFELCCA